jgi:Secretion system C-terminal sorting domain
MSLFVHYGILNKNKSMKTLIPITLFVILAICFSNSVIGQSSFRFRITDPSTDEIVNDAIELSNGSYILACCQAYPLPNKVHLVRISHSGQQIGSSDFYFQGQSSGFISILQMSPNKFLFAGYELNVSNYNIWFYETDSLFNEIKSKVVSLDTLSLFSLKLIPDGSGDILCQGIYKTPSQFPYAFIYKFSSTLDSLQFKLFTDHPVMFQPSLLNKIDNTGYYFFLTGYHDILGNYNEAILNLDTSFSINRIDSVPQLITEYPNSKWINTKTFLITGRLDDIVQPQNRGIEILSLDTNITIKHDLYVGDHDTIEWPGMRKNLDYLDTNLIFIGGTHNFCRWEICNTICWFSLTNMDSTLNPRWQKFYGGNADYTLYGLTATQDGGCLLYGTIYDSATMYNERDVYVIKVDKDGLVGIDDNKTNHFVHGAIVYPNPGTDHLIIESGPQISGALFQMNSIDGKQVMTKTLNERKLTLSTQSLQTGTYVWQIIFNGKVIETGKWVKER